MNYTRQLDESVHTGAADAMAAAIATCGEPMIGIGCQGVDLTTHVAPMNKAVDVRQFYDGRRLGNWLPRCPKHLHTGEEPPMYFSKNLPNLFGINRADDPSCVISISDYDVAVLRSRTGQPAIAIRRAAMKVGSDLKRIEAELNAMRMNGR